jgi:hypothetical protein
MENGTALPFSILHSSIIEYAQTATPIIGEAFSILHSSINESTQTATPIIGEHSPFAKRLLPLLRVQIADHEKRCEVDAG